jgi:hypothetical protein
VRLLEMWNRFGCIPLRQKCISQQAVGCFEVGAEFDGLLQWRNSGRIIPLLDVHSTDIGERNCQFRIEFGGLFKFGERGVQLPTLFGIHSGMHMLDSRRRGSLQREES